MMADSNDDESLIGYDPLAWLQKSEDQAPQDNAVSIAGSLEIVDNQEPMDYPADSDSIHDPVDVVVAGDGIMGIRTDTSNQVILEPIQTIQNITQLHERLSRALESGLKIEIDAGAVTNIDTASLQLLLILTRTATELQREVVVDFPSERFIEAAKLLGLDELLGVDLAPAGFF